MDIKKAEKILKEFVENIISQVAGKGYKVDVSSTNIKPKDKDEEYTIFNIDVDGDDVDLLIGYHGKNLKALTTIVTSFLCKKYPEDKFRIAVDIGGYYKRKLEYVQKLAQQAIDEVKILEEPYEFKPMPARLRRVIHELASKDKKVYSESKGEGRERHVVIYPNP